MKGIPTEQVVGNSSAPLKWKTWGKSHKGHPASAGKGRHKRGAWSARGNSQLRLQLLGAVKLICIHPPKLLFALYPGLMQM